MRRKNLEFMMSDGLFGKDIYSNQKKNGCTVYKVFVQTKNLNAYCLDICV